VVGIAVEMNTSVMDRARPDARRSRAAGDAQAPAASPKGASSSVSKVAWQPKAGLNHGEWMAAGRQLGAIGRCSQWWVGDWIRYGTSKWGEKYAEAARVTGYDVASLRNMAWVASQFEPSLRSDKLTWSHHVLLAPLEPEEQRQWIERAVESRFSVADLRIELRAEERKGKERLSESPAAEAGGLEVACPHCGHQFVLSGDASEDRPTA
jgi:hypothetical protein